MNKLIRIQSTTTIAVTCGLQHQDHTNPDAHIPDRLKVSPDWPKATILIHQGVGEYPAEIANWPTVKSLVKSKIFTIGETIETDDTAKTAECEKLDRTMKEINPQKRTRKAKTLDEITEE